MDILRTPIRRSIPKTLVYYDINGKEHLVGYYAEVIKNFAHYHHLQFQWQNLADYRQATVHKRIQEGYYNLSLNGAVYRRFVSNMSFSYPLEWSRICIMVPTEDELPRFWYVVWPFGAYIWTTVGILVICAAVVMTFLKHPSTSFSKNLLNSLAIIQFSANMNVDNVTHSLRLMAFYFLLLTTGLILSSYYCSYLPAYNVRPIFQPFMNSVDDLKRAKVKVLIQTPVLEELRNSKQVNFSIYEMLFQESNVTKITSKFKAINHSFAYAVSPDQWHFFQRLQRHLIQPLFQLSDICFGDTLISFPIMHKWHYASSLDHFILLCQQSGLWQQWQEEAYLAALSAKYYTIPQDAYPVTPLNVAFFRIAWIVLFAGIFISCGCLLLEFWWTHRNELQLDYIVV